MMASLAATSTSWLGSMLAGGTLPADASVALGHPDFAAELAARGGAPFALPTPAIVNPGKGTTSGATVPSPDPRDAAIDAAELGAWALPLPMDEPLPSALMPLLGASVRPADLDAAESTVERDGADWRANASSASLANASGAGAAMLADEVHVISPWPMTSFAQSVTATIASALPAWGSAVAPGSGGNSWVASDSLLAVDGSATSALPAADALASIELATEGAGEGAGSVALSAGSNATPDADARLRLAGGVATDSPDTTAAATSPTAVVETDAPVQAPARVATVEELEALELLDWDPTTESMDHEDPSATSSLEDLHEHPLLQTLDGIDPVAQSNAEVLVQQGQRARSTEERPWKLTAGDVGRRVAVQPAASATDATRAPSNPSADAQGNVAADAKLPASAAFSALPASGESTVESAANGAGPAPTSTVQNPTTDSQKSSGGPAADEDPEPTKPTAAPQVHHVPETVSVRETGVLGAPSDALDLGARLRLAIAETIVDAGRDRLLESVRDSFDARVTVNPPHLGTVQVQVTRESADTGINILLVAAHEDAARALETEADELIDDLVRHRLEVNEVHVRRGEHSATDQRDGQRSPAQEQAARERREQQQAHDRAEERQQGQRRPSNPRWSFAEPYVSEPGQQAAREGERP